MITCPLYHPKKYIVLIPWNIMCLYWEYLLPLVSINNDPTHMNVLIQFNQPTTILKPIFSNLSRMILIEDSNAIKYGRLWQPKKLEQQQSEYICKNFVIYKKSQIHNTSLYVKNLLENKDHYLM